MNRLTVVALILLSLGCTRTSERDSDGAFFCQINRSEAYQVSTDPTVDFVATNQVKTISFNNVTCPDVDNNSFSTFVNFIEREGNSIFIREQQPSQSGFNLNFFVTGTSIIPFENSFKINGCTVKRTWTGSLDAPGTAINLVQNIDYYGNCQPVFVDDMDRP